MEFRSTIDSVVEDSTLVGQLPPGPVHHAAFPRARHHDEREGRDYGKLCQDTMKRAGHLDTRNTRLTIPDKVAHTLRHANLNCRNPGDKTRHMGNRSHTDRRVPRGVFDNYGGMAVFGNEMKNVVTMLDPTSSVNAIEVEDFQHGGTRPDDVRGTMIGAGVSVPVDNLDGTNLNNSYGLHYAIDIKPGSSISNMQKKSMNAGIAKQSGSKTVGRAKPYAV
tara:strand:- start:51 stop:710 length:660 start_codon:yes stop_codon:yes gene_type:complete